MRWLERGVSRMIEMLGFARGTIRVEEPMAWRNILRHLVVALCVAGCGGGTAQAGGGPENVLLVVNSASWASQTIANHYIALRHIPPLNVFYVDWTGGFEGTDVDAFRDKILGPALDTAERRGIRNQIDYVLYSSDFPYSIDLTNDFQGRYKFPQAATPACSLNSATFLFNLIYAKLPLSMDLRINHYMRAFEDRTVEPPTHGFRSWYGWGNEGELQEAGGQPYMLSTMLAITSGRGNSVREAISYLERSAAADGTRPSGTIYFSKTDDIRSKKREPGYAAAIEELKKLGVKAHVIGTPLPVGKSDVAGLMMGAAEYSLAKSHCKVLPGAICENFTSFGGILTESASQTPLTEMLRYGAAGSSGTIVEPLALPEKFPWPSVQVHYARGASLAESFYQSVFAPAQLLIVGDALCRPWADIPQVQVAGLKEGQSVSGKVEIGATASLAGGGQIERFQLFADGRLVDTVRTGERLTWDTSVETDGYHQLRVVAIAGGDLETQGRAIMSVQVDNKQFSAQLSTVPAEKARWDETLTVRAKAAGMKQIYIVHNGRPLGMISGEEGEITVSPRTLGLGPIELHALAIGTAGPQERVASAPLTLSIEPPRALPALNDPSASLAPGIALKLANEKIVTVQETRDVAWLELAGVNQNQNFTAQAFFDVPTTDVYQFQVWHYGQLKLLVDGLAVYDGQQGNFKQKFAPVSLAAGRHRVTVTGRTASDVKLRILFGGPGAVSLHGKQFKHQTR
jgi:hypothetical protein